MHHKPSWNDDFAPSNSKIFSADAEAPHQKCGAQPGAWGALCVALGGGKVIISEGFGLKISIFRKVKNLMVLRSKNIFRYQIWTPELSEMIRELKNIIFIDLWKKSIFSPHVDP